VLPPVGPVAPSLSCTCRLRSRVLVNITILW
jgi:hypothetical protein